MADLVAGLPPTIAGCALLTLGCFHTGYAGVLATRDGLDPRLRDQPMVRRIARRYLVLRNPVRAVHSILFALVRHAPLSRDQREVYLNRFRGFVEEGLAELFQSDLIRISERR